MSLALDFLGSSSRRRACYPIDRVGGAPPLFAYGIKKLRSAYSGPALRVVRPSDSATQDIGFSGQNIDSASLASFLGGQTGHIDIFYDQSGNGNDATQTTDAQRPLIEASTLTGGYPANVNGVPVVIFNNHFMNLPAGLTTQSQSNSFYSALETYGYNPSAALVQLGSGASQETFFFGPLTNSHGYLRANPSTGNSAFTIQSRMCVYASVMSATATNAQQGVEIINGPAATAVTMTGGTLGKTTLGSFPGSYYAGAFINYGRALTTAEDAAIKLSLNTAFSVSQNPSGRVLWFGDSITASSAPPGNSYFGYAKMASRSIPSEHIYNLGEGGTQIQNRLGFYANQTGYILSQYSDNRVVFMLIGTNDLTIGGRTAAQIYADIQTYCGNIRTSGGKVVVATLLPNSAWNSAQQTTRTDLNTLIRTNWASFADGLADFANDPTMGPQAAAANTSLYADGLHPTRLGHTYLAPIALNAIKPLL